MSQIELNRAKIIRRLLAEGWILEGGTKHEKFSHPNFQNTKIMVPRHKTLSAGVARSIAKAANW